MLLRRYFVAELCAAGELAAADTTDAADAVAVPPPAPLSLPRVGGVGGGLSGNLLRPSMHDARPLCCGSVMRACCVAMRAGVVVSWACLS